MHASSNQRLIWPLRSRGRPGGGCRRGGTATCPRRAPVAARRGGTRPARGPRPGGRGQTVRCSEPAGPRRNGGGGASGRGGRRRGGVAAAGSGRGNGGGGARGR